MEVDTQTEANFLNEWLRFQGAHNDDEDESSQVWTGGVSDTAAGRSFLFWHHSRTPVKFSKLLDESILAAGSDADGVSSRGLAMRDYRVRWNSQGSKWHRA